MLNSVLYNRLIDFGSYRAVLQGGEITVTPRVKERVLERAFRFFTFQRSYDLLAVNQKLTRSFEQLVTEVNRAETAKRATVFTNLAKLNEKFIKGNTTSIILRIINYVLSFFGLEISRYTVLDIEKLKGKVDQNVSMIPVTDTPSDNSLKDTDSSLVLIPKPIPGNIMDTPLDIVLKNGTNHELTLGTVLNNLSPAQQSAALRIFEKGELSLTQHQFKLLMGNTHLVNLGLKTEGDVCLQLQPEELETLQLALCGKVDENSRLLAGIVLASVGSNALLLLKKAEEEPELFKNSLPLLLGQADIRLLLEGVTKEDAKPKKIEKPVATKTFLERITDNEDPPILKIEGHSLSVKYIKKERCFIIDNLSDVPFSVTSEGVMMNGRYYAFSDSSKQKPFILLNRKHANHEKDIFELQVQADYYHKISYGSSSLTISLEHLNRKDL